jgi:hypothetical protein
LRANDEEGLRQEIAAEFRKMRRLWSNKNNRGVALRRAHEGGCSKGLGRVNVWQYCGTEAFTGVGPAKADWQLFSSNRTGGWQTV